MIRYEFELMIARATISFCRPQMARAGQRSHRSSQLLVAVAANGIQYTYYQELSLGGLRGSSSCCWLTRHSWVARKLEDIAW